jgi:hypothetical protein
MPRCSHDFSKRPLRVFSPTLAFVLLTFSSCTDSTGSLQKIFPTKNATPRVSQPPPQPNDETLQDTLPQKPAALYEIFVSPTGDDKATGELSAPLLSLLEAQKRVRLLKQKFPETPLNISVVLREGTYFLEKPLIFSSEDSGWKDKPIVFKSFPGERVILSGGVPIEKWTSVAGAPTYSAPAPDFPFRQIFAGGKSTPRPVRARHPKNSFLKVAAYVTAGSLVSHIELEPDSLIQSGSLNLAGAELVVLKTFEQSRLGVTSLSSPTATGGFSLQIREIDGKNEGVISTGEQGNWHKKAGARAYLEGTVAMLSQPGEWAKSGATLIYYPHAQEKLDSAHIVVPHLESLMQVGEKDREKVSYLAFREIEFRHTTWNQPSASGYSGMQTGMMVGTPNFIPAGITIQNASNISLERCRIAQFGAGGINIDAGVSDTSLVENYLSDISGGGIVINNPTLSKSVDENITVKDNLIELAGQEYDAPGILVGFTKNAKVLNNSITNTTGMGISIGWFYGPEGVGANQVSYNEIANVLSLYDDGGGIYTPGPNPGLLITYNWIHDIPGNSQGIGLQPGIYFDGASSGGTAQNNLLQNLAQGVYVQFCCGVPAKNVAAINQHMVNVLQPIPFAESVQPAIAPNGNQLSYDHMYVPSTATGAGPAPEIREYWRKKREKE